MSVKTKEELRKERGRVISVFIPNVLLDWMKGEIEKGRYLHYAEIVRQGISYVRGESEGDIGIVNRSRDY